MCNYPFGYGSVVPAFTGSHHDEVDFGSSAATPMNMSLVGGYPQAYPAGPMSHDLYSYPHPQVHPQTRYDPHPDAGYFQSWMLNSQGDLGLAPESYGFAPQGADYGGMLGFMGDGTGPGMRVRCVKRRVTANKKERRRTQSINTAFTNLRDCIPNVPSDTKLSKIKIIPKERRRTQNLNSAFTRLRASIPNVPQDTKLSKIKTLRLATSYISYLMDILNKDDPSLTEVDFKAELTKKSEKEKEDRRKEELEELAKAEEKHAKDKKNKGRTGWPQHVWAAELKH